MNIGLSYREDIENEISNMTTPISKAGDKWLSLLINFDEIYVKNVTKHILNSL
jgi:hypothetical protein